jgi:hypothetical protein
MFQLTIVGDRLAGKTHILVDFAIDEAARGGGTVWYQSSSRAMSHHMVKRVQDRAEELVPKLVKRVSTGNGYGRIVFTSGGVIDFDGKDLWRTGQVIALHCMDEVFCEPYPHAKRAVRAVLR